MSEDLHRKKIAGTEELFQTTEKSITRTDTVKSKPENSETVTDYS